MNIRALLVFLSMTAIISCTQKEEQVLNDLVDTHVKALRPDKRVAILDVTPIERGEKVVLTGKTNFPHAADSLTSQLGGLGYDVVDSIEILPPASLNGRHWGVVRLSVCNIRSKPKHAAELSTQAVMGTPLRIWDVKGDWYRVQTPDLYLGWLDKDGFTAMDEAAINRWSAWEKLIIHVLSDHVYADRKMTKTLSDVVAGSVLAVTAKTRHHWRVVLPDGRMGFVPAGAGERYDEWLQRQTFDIDQMLATAHQFIGYPYLWGGTSAHGMDCSGYTKTVFYLHGLNLPRDASQQVHVGEEIPTDSSLVNLQRGDLLFFGRKATDDQPEKIWHVAIYLGEGHMIHSAGNVKIESLRRSDSLFNAERLRTFVRAKRLTSDHLEHSDLALRHHDWYHYEVEN